MASQTFSFSSTDKIIKGKSNNQITRESIGKIDNQMSSGIELKLVAIHQPDYYTLFFSPGIFERDFEHRKQYLTKHPLR